MEFDPLNFLWHITAATLFLMTLFTFTIAIKSKLKPFYAYCVYSFFLLIYIIFNSSYHNFGGNIFGIGYDIHLTFRWLVQVIYNCVYIFFFIYLLEIKKHLKEFEKQLRISVLSLFIFSFTLGVVSVMIGNGHLFEDYFKFVFTPIISIIGIVCLIKLWKIPGHLKVYFFIGGLFYLTFALTALLMSIFEINIDENAKGLAPLSYFYLGVIIEQIFFGFALAYFIQNINKNYKEALESNLHLKDKHNQELSKKLTEQSKQLKQMAEEAKAKKVAYIKSQYDAKLNESRLSSLQSKMNPHFIFNALNSIKAYLIDNDKRKAINYMNRFSKLVRRILESSRIESISLKKELEIIQLYVDIENTRFNNEIDFAILNLSKDEDLAVSLPPLILQPFVENALWHGLSGIDRDKKLRIRIKNDNDMPYIEIEDNGVGLNNSKKSKEAEKIKKKSMGIKLNQERLWVFNQKFNTNYSFEMANKNGETSGTIVRFYLKQKAGLS